MSPEKKYSHDVILYRRFKFESSRRLYQKACGFDRESKTHVTEAITSEQERVGKYIERETREDRHLETVVKCSCSHRQ